MMVSLYLELSRRPLFITAYFLNSGMSCSSAMSTWTAELQTFERIALTTLFLGAVWFIKQMSHEERVILCGCYIWSCCCLLMASHINTRFQSLLLTVPACPRVDGSMEAQVKSSKPKRAAACCAINPPVTPCSATASVLGLLHVLSISVLPSKPQGRKSRNSEIAKSVASTKSLRGYSIISQN